MRTDPNSVIAICWNLPDEWIWLKRVAWQTRMCLDLIQGARKIQATYIVNPQFTLRTYNESSVYTQIFWHQSCRVSRMIVWKQKKWKITYLCKFLHFVFRFHIRLYCSLLLLFQNPKALSRFLDLYTGKSTPRWKWDAAHFPGWNIRPMTDTVWIIIIILSGVYLIPSCPNFSSFLKPPW